MTVDETFEKFHGTWPAIDDPDYQAYATERDAYKCGWDAARAGMAPESECTHVGKRTELWDRLHEKLNAAIVEHEAELAKAWEAGRDAAARVSDDCSADRIRALQPPGGNAK